MKKLSKIVALLLADVYKRQVQSMVLTACKRGDEIILPRNVHRSVLNALVLCTSDPAVITSPCSFA